MSKEIRLRLRISMEVAKAGLCPFQGKKWEKILKNMKQ